MDFILADELVQTKLLSALVLFVITLLAGYLPVRMILNQRYIQYAMFAGGGVLMATAFCHLIPETHDNYRLASDGLLHSHPAPTSNVSQAQHSNETGPPLNYDGQLGKNNSLASNSSQALDHPPNHFHDDNSSDVHAHDAQDAHGHEPHSHEHMQLPLIEITLCCGFFFMYIVEQLIARFVNSHTHEHPCDTGRPAAGALSSSNNNSSATIMGAADSVDVISASGTSLATSLASPTAGEPSSGSATATHLYKFLRGLLIVSAFGAHAIFDGVAIASGRTVDKVWTLFGAITCHKLIVAAVVGLELFAATLESHLWTLIHLSIFSIMSPIGIVLVVVAQNSFELNPNDPAMILLQSFATGTLLYIVFIEILQPKESQLYEKNRFGKSLSLVAGFGLMVCVLTLMPH